MNNMETTPTDQPIYYTLEQVAKMLQISERTVLREISAGKIRAFKAGRALRFKREWIQEYIDAQAVKPGDDLEA